MNITIFGLGYVGCVTAALMAKDGHNVFGVDISEQKVNQLSNGISPIVEPGLDEIVAEVHASGKLRATLDVKEGLENSEISLICVGTPSANDGSLDLRYVKQVATQIGQNLSVTNGKHTIVVRSTVLPGSTRGHIIPVVEQAAGCSVGDRFEVCTNPEFLREGSSIKDYYEPPRILVGERIAGAGSVVHDLYKEVEAERYSVDLEVAEAVKYSDNAFHAMKVVFANEIDRVWSAVGADPKQVMKIVTADSKLNISPYYLRPGFAFGGSCLPKDLRAMCSLAKSNQANLPMLENLIPSNKIHIEHSVAKIKATGYRKIALIGLAFKGDTDDLRESPYVALAKVLIGEGYDLNIYDPIVQMSGLNGSNKRYMCQEIPHITRLIHDDFQRVIKDSELIVVGHSFPEQESEIDWVNKGKHFLHLG